MDGFHFKGLGHPLSLLPADHDDLQTHRCPVGSIHHPFLEEGQAKGAGQETNAGQRDFLPFD